MKRQLNGAATTPAPRRLGDYFRQSKERGREGLPLLSVTMNDGMVDRESLDRKMDSELKASEHLLVRPGDLAYNMMRMWQGALAIADREGLVSPAYVVARPTEAIDPKFAGYFLKSARMMHQLWAYSYGLTDDRLRLYYKDFAMIRTEVPPLAEQRRIAEILSTWDAAIEQTEKLLAAKEQMKRGLLDRLLQAFHTGHRLRLGQIADVNPSTKLVGDSVPFLEMAAVKTGAPDVEYLLERSVQTSGCTFRNGDTLFAKITPCAENGKIAFVDFLPEGKTGQGSTELAVLRPDATLVRPRFLYALCRSRFVHPKVICVMEGTSGRQRIPTDAFREPFVPVPGHEEQDRVLQILNTADAELAGLRSLTDLLRRQKQGLMQMLLTGKVRVTVERTI